MAVSIPGFFAFWKSVGTGLPQNGEELSGQDRYWACCADSMDKRGIELMRLLFGKMRAIYDLLFWVFYGKLKTLHYNTRLLKYAIMKDGGALNEYI